MSGDLLPWVNFARDIGKSRGGEPSLENPIQLRGKGDIDFALVNLFLSRVEEEDYFCVFDSLKGIARDLPRGKVTASIQVSSSVKKWRESSEAQVHLEGSGISAFGWQIDEAVGDLKLNGGVQRTQLDVKSLRLVTRDRKAVSGVQSGLGGTVSLSNWSISLFDKQKEWIIPLMLADAHSHWLAGSEVGTFFPLQTRLTGPVQLHYFPSDRKTPWRLKVEAKAGLSAERMTLDNQDLGKKVTAVSPVLDIRKFRVQGSVVADPSRVAIEPGTQLGVGSSRIEVSGYYDFNTGFDIRGKASAFSMQNIGTLAGVPIRGEGAIQLRVHGPSERVILDFFPDLQSAEYLSLYLGHIQGQISFDFETEEVSLRKGELRYPQSILSLEGVVGLHGKGSLLLDVGVRNGEMHDVLGVFKNLSKDIDWFPRTLSGRVSGSARVSGELSMDEMIVHTELKGEDWTDWGERFKEVDLVGGLYLGRYELKSFLARKSTGLINASVGMDRRTNEIEWRLKTDSLRLNDIDLLARLDVPMRGNILIESEGRGRLGQVQSSSILEITDTMIRGLSFPPSRVSVSSGAGGLRVEGLGFGGQAQLSLRSSEQKKQLSLFKMKLDRLDFSPFLLILNPKLIQDRSLVGMVSAQVDLSYPRDELRYASGQIRLDQFVLSKTGTRLDLVKPVSIDLEEGAYQFESGELKGKEGSVRFSGRANSSRIDLQAAGGIDLSVVEFLTPLVQQTQGVIRFEGGVEGKAESPDIYAEGQLERASTRVVSLDAPLENLKTRFQMKKGILRLFDGTAELSGGRLRGGGTVGFFLDRVPTLDLQGGLDGAKLKVPPLHYVRASGNFQLKGDHLPYLASGVIVTDSALYKEKFASGGSSKGAAASVATRFLPPPTTRNSASIPFMEYDLQLRADRGIWVQNDLVDSEWKAQMRITGSPENPSIIGTADLVAGRMLFKDRAFQMQSGHVDFDTPYTINPAFNVVGQADVSDYRVLISVTGRPDSIRIGLSSNPMLPESDLITLLALGGTATVASGGRLADRTVVQTAEAASLVLQSADFNRSLKDRTGLQLGFDEAVDQGVGSSIFKPRGDAATASAPKIVVKRQIGKKIDVSVGSTVGFGSNSQKEVNAEFKVTPGFSVIGVWDSLEGADAQSRESFGVDLKLQKRFK